MNSDSSPTPVPDRFPFPKSFHFRKDEEAALEGLFEKTFFDAPYSEEALAALKANRYPSPRAASGAGASDEREADAMRSVILCRGADGIGKTRIFHHLRARARAREVPVYEIYNYEVEGIPLKPFLHTIRRILRDLDIGSLFLEKYRYTLQRLIPEEYEERAPERASPAGFDDLLATDKVRIFDGITQLLLDVATRKPLLILVHDLHWGDLATVDLLQYIGRNVALRNRRSPVRPRLRRGEGEAPADRFSYKEADDELKASQVGKYVNVSRRVAGAPPRGPEIDGFESEGWRVLAPRPMAPLVYDSWSDDGVEFWGGSAPSSDGTGARRGVDPGLRPARLMIFSNYRAFSEEDWHIQAAVDHLGRQSFAYHMELQPLESSEADGYIQKSTQGIAIAGEKLEVTAEGVETLQRASEGFPSFQQELFRGIYLEDDRRHRWTGETINAYLGKESPGEADASAGDEEEKKTEEPAPAPATPHRLRILRRRIETTSEEETRILQVLALARRPLAACLIGRVLAKLESAARAPAAAEPAGEAPVAADEDAFSWTSLRTEELLEGLESRGLVEHSDRACPGGLGPQVDGYFFRLWDYTTVVEECIEPEVRTSIHKLLAEEFRVRLEHKKDEGAYEVYYHFRSGGDAKAAVEYGLAAAERFVRSFSLEKARRLYRDLLELLDDEESLPLRLEILSKIARISASLKDTADAEQTFRQISHQENGTLSAAQKLDLLLLEAEVAGCSDPAKGLKILGRAPKLVEDENGPEGARLYFAITRLRLLRQDWKRAINFGLKGISICQKISDDGPELGAFYQLVARAFYRKGDYSHAVDNFQRGLEAAEAHANRSLMVSILDDLGRVYLERGEYFRSARYLFKALEIRRNDVDVIGLSRSYDQLSLCYQRNGDYLRTIEYLNLSLRLKERIGDFEGLNPTLGNLGDLYWRLGQYTRAIAIFRREVENSQTLKATNQDETVWLVDSFIRLGRTYFEIGDLKRAEDYCKQALNLATEFKLRSQEADGRLLEGNLRAHERDWGPAEKSLRWAAEAYAKLGHRYREAAAILDLAAMKLAREQHDEALKLASRAQLIADEIKIMDLQVRALIVKGNVHRFLKGGNPEKVRENFSKALEISQNLSDVTILFLLFYSLAKVHHGERELTEAANYYGKAEAILKRIIDGLPENLASRFQEDRRRQVFAEDLMRFRKEAQSRSTVIDARERTLSGADLRDRPAGLADFKDLMARILRVDRAVGQLHFYEQLLSECVELAGADRGLLLRVQNREYLPVSFQGFGSEPTHHPEYPAASHLTEEAIRRGKTILHSGGDISQLGRFVHLETLTGRCIMAVPLMTDERIFGGVYLDKPAALGRFATREQTLVESFAEHAGIAFQNRRQLDIAIREPMTGFYTPNYFIDRLREAYRWYNLHGRSFSLIGYYVPVIESALGEGREGLGEELARAIAEVVPYRSAICWGNPVLYLLLSDVDLSSGAEEMAERVRAKLEDLLGEDVPHEIAVAERHYQQGAEIYFDLRRKLLPEEADQRTLFELRRLLASELTIKEAKGLLEKHIIERTLRKTHGNITHAARELGIHRPQLSNLLKKYRLKREVFEGPASRRMHPGDN